MNFAEKIALIHEKVSETLLAYRKNNLNGKNGVAEELSDIIARVLHLASIYNLDVEKALLEKIRTK